VAGSPGRVPDRDRNSGWIYQVEVVYTTLMGKHLVDIDEAALAAAQAELGTASMKDTVNEALRRTIVRRSARVQKSLDRLGQRRRPPREEAWR
jgi:Arc/MetJ family transcription regulator